jgi:hypothetical protein
MHVALTTSPCATALASDNLSNLQTQFISFEKYEYQSILTDNLIRFPLTTAVPSAWDHKTVGSGIPDTEQLKRTD